MGSNPTASATILSFRIRIKSQKPNFSKGLNVIRVHGYPCSSTSDRLVMWEIWEHGKAFRYRCKGSKTTWMARRWRWAVFHCSAWWSEELDVPSIEKNGHRRDFCPGRASKVSLATARERACEIRAWVELGLDPIFERCKAEGIPTFRQAAAKVIAAHSKTWRHEKHARQWHQTLEAYVFS